MSDREVIGDERRFELLVEAASDYAICMLDRAGRVTSWNSGGERLHGYAPAEILGRPFADLFAEEDRRAEMPSAMVAQAAETGRCEHEGWSVRKDGSRFRAMSVVDALRDEDNRLSGFAVIERDITEQQTSQRALRDSERQFQLLVRGVVDYALYMLDTHGVVTSWNPGAQQIKGYNAEEIIGQHFSRFYTESDRAAGTPFRALSTAREHGRFEGEGWRVRKDGSLFWASVVIDAIRNDDGALIGFAKITRDITERRQAQTELQAAQARLAQAQKMEALGELTGGVAHDFNNLMMIVSGQAQTLRRLLGASAPAARSLEAIDLAVERAESLTRQLLTFSRRQRLNPRPIDLRQRIADVREMLTSSLRGDIALEIEVGENLWPVSVDVGELELALVNIAVNARDAMPDGGVFRVAAENVELKPGERGLDLEGGFVAVTLADSGVGIPQDILPRVFDPFFTTKPTGKGTGLGLSQVYGLAHQSGGAIAVESELGQGTRVTVFLPRSTAEPAVEAPQAQEPSAPGGRILVVEDNPDVAAVSAALLEQLGYEAEVVGDAEQALATLAGGRRFDLVFSDIVMAGAMDGVALARHLRELMPGLPVLLASGYSRAAEAALAEFAILRKPFHIGELGRSIGRLLRRPARVDETNLLPFPTARRNGG